MLKEFETGKSVEELIHKQGISRAALYNCRQNYGCMEAGEFKRLNQSQLRELAILETFDWLSSGYENPQTATTARQLLEQAGMRDIEVLKAGYLVARARN
jgi:hypothetical protein